MAAARHPRLYAEYGVPDTVDGRFEMISLHTILVLRALASRTEPEVEEMRQQLVDELFRDMDRSLREMGIGDLSVGKKVRKMAEVFYGRLKVYSEALDGAPGALESAFARNVWPEGEAGNGAARLAGYTRQADALVMSQAALASSGQPVDFGEPL